MHIIILPVISGIVLTCLSPLSALAEDLVISGYEQVLDLDCADRNALVEGMKQRVTLTMPCASLTVAGSENTVGFDTAGSITFMGTSNRITGALAATAPSNGPDVTLAGLENVLTLRFDRPAVVQVSGSGNKVIWTVGPGVPKPEFQIKGENNSVEGE